MLPYIKEKPGRDLKFKNVRQPECFPHVYGCDNKAPRLNVTHCQGMV